MAAAILKMALRNAVLTAGMALTIDVLVHHKTPEIARTPGVEQIYGKYRIRSRV